MKRFFPMLVALILVATSLGCAAPSATPSDAAKAATSSDATPQDAAAVEQPTASVPAVDLGVEVKTYDELIAALNDTAVSKAHISAEMEIAPTEEQTFEREGFVLTIDEGITVTVRDNFVPVFFGTENAPGLVVNGTLAIAGTLNFGAMTLLNNGTLEVLSGATLSPGMSTIENHGQVLVDAGGTIRLERGTALRNFGTVTNLGEIDITSDGGSLQNAAEAALENNGNVKFDGDYQNEGFYSGAQQEP